MKDTCRFYISRLRNASLPELAYRAQELVFVGRVRSAVARRRAPAVVPAVEPLDARVLVPPAIRVEGGGAGVEELLAGMTFTLNTDPGLVRECEERLRNTFSPDAGKEQLPCDIRAVWEPARLQHLTVLLARLERQDDAALSAEIQRFVRDSLFAWLDANPFLTGPHYMSAMECGLRVPVFFLALKQLEGLSRPECGRLLEAIYLHAWWIDRRLSLYSSLGNHTVCECVGLVFAGAVFRRTEEGKGWLARGIRLLRQELDHQVLQDGGPVEQSVSYHRFVLDLYWMAVDFLESNNLSDCSDFKPRLRAGEEFLAAFRSGRGPVPAIGDSDDGHALGPGLAPKRLSPESRGMRVRAFSSSGYTVIRGRDDVLLTFDHGPLGMAPLFNHGHADALSVTLAAGGKPVLVDPGTYGYNGDPLLRRYFKGTRAHNTVTVDGEDQAVQQTGFIWSHPYRTRLVRALDTADGFLVEAEHDGYGRLPGGVRHRRAVLFFDNRHYLIRDTFTGEGMHRYELHFHLHPEAAVQQTAESFRVDVGGVTVHLQSVGGPGFEYVRGEEGPLLGWHSPAYGVLQESGVLRCEASGRPAEVSFVTAICVGEQVQGRKLEGALCRIETIA